MPMKTLLLPLAMTAALLLVAPLHAQTTEDEIKADLLRLQIIAALEAENHAAAADLFDQYEALGVDISPPLQLQRAVVYFRLQRYADAELQLRAYLGRAERGSTDYSQALNMLAEVIAQAAAAEAAAKAAAAAKLEEAMRANDSATVLRLLQSGADANATDNDGETSLLRWAASGGHTEIAALLLKRGADANAKNGDGETPLHHVAYQGHTEITALLLKHDADVNAKDDDGNTPLHDAADKGRTEIAALLLKHDADVNAKNDDGETPLHDAAYQGHTEIAALLLKQGADVNAKNNAGNTPRKVAKLFIDDKKARRAMRKLLRQHGGRE